MLLQNCYHTCWPLCVCLCVSLCLCLCKLEWCQTDCLFYNLSIQDLLLFLYYPKLEVKIVGFIKKLAFLSIWRWSNPLNMRWYTGVLVIEKCQASGMQQVQISGVYGLGTLSGPSSSHGCSSRILECKTWTDSLITLDCDLTANAWPEFCPQSCHMKHETESISQYTPKENPRNSYSDRTERTR